MALLVDPPPRDSAGGHPRDSAGGRPPAEVPSAVPDEATAASAVPVIAEPESFNPEPGEPEFSTPRLAEPPLTGGRVEVLMGELIRVLSHSPLARPLPAVILSALGLGGIAVNGLCATAPQPSVATPPVLLPLTSVARNLGARHLPDLAANLIMYSSITLCCLGLAMMLWANSRGWSPRPWKVFWTAAGAVAVLVNITPVGSGDVASYAAYGRIAALGHNPYTFTPNMLPGGAHNAYTEIVGVKWQATPSVYGPVATWMHLIAALIGGDKAWLTIWVLMIMMGAAFLATGYVLLRTAENPVRAALLWVANPLLIFELVIGGHMDAFLALLAIAAIVMSRRCTSRWHDLAVGLLVGIAGGIKITAAFVALAIAIPLIHDRAWARLARTAVVAGVTTFGLYIFSYGLGALGLAFADSKLVISPTIWRLIQVTVQHYYGDHAEATVTSAFGFIWYPLMLLLAWYLYNRLSPDVPTVVAATCALTFAFMVLSPWQLPWYSAVAWVTLARLPRNSLTRWLTIATGALALMHFNGGQPTNMPVGPTP
jgi:Glycosyltransferase family 87